MDALLVDGRSDLVTVKGLCRVIRSTGVTVPVLLVTTEGASPESIRNGASTTSCWTAPDRRKWMRDFAWPWPVAAMRRTTTLIRSGELVVDESAYSARLRNRPPT